MEQRTGCRGQIVDGRGQAIRLIGNRVKGTGRGKRPLETTMARWVASKPPPESGAECSVVDIGYVCLLPRRALEYERPFCTPPAARLPLP